jgi:hypothetical protein
MAGRIEIDKTQGNETDKGHDKVLGTVKTDPEHRNRKSGATTENFMTQLAVENRDGMLVMAENKAGRDQWWTESKQTEYRFKQLKPNTI